MNIFSRMRDESHEELKQTFDLNQALDLSPAILNYADLLALELPQRQSILPWLPEGGLVMVSAERGIGKTYFALSLAYAVTTGTSFMKWPVVQPTGVLYIDGEMALTDIRERLKRFLQSTVPVNLHILSHEWFYQKFDKDLTMTETDLQEALLSHLDAMLSTRLVILDNLSSLSKIREDKSDDWRQFMLPFLIKCRRRGVAVIVIHHCGKDGNQRGTGAREDHLDASILLSKLNQEHDKADMSSCFQVSFTKSRHCFGDTIAPFTAHLQNQEGFAEWRLGEIKLSHKDQVYKVILEHEDSLTGEEIADLCGISPPYVSKIKKILREEGLISTKTCKQAKKSNPSSKNES